jgi:DNA polymerase III subunit epsilon
VRPPRPHAASAAELAAHAAFLKQLSDPIWLKAAA